MQLRNIFLFLVIILVASCRRTELPQQEQGGNSATNVRLYLSVAEQSVVQTKTDKPDDYIDPTSVYLLVFDNNDILTDWHNSSMVKLDGGIMSLVSTLENTDDTRKVYILANADALINDKINSSIWVKNSTTLTKVQQDLITVSLPTSGAFIGQQPYRHPMINNTPVILDRITSTTVITGAGGGAVELTRATAKITVCNATSTEDFELLGASLANAPVRGFVFPNVLGTSGAPAITTQNYGVGGVLDNMMVGAETVSDPLTSVVAGNTKPLYLYESQASNNTFLIMKVRYKGVEGYHRINLVNDRKEQLPLNRNYHYRVNINNVLTPGYRTAIETFNHPTNQDVNYDITVDDGTSHDIASNGKQYIATSASNVIIYQSTGLNDIFVATIKYTTRVDWNAGVITLPSGWSLVGSNISTSLPTAPAGAVITRELHVRIPDNATEGKITLRIGDLAQVINVSKRSNIPAFGTPLKFDKYVVGIKDRVDDNPTTAPNQPSGKGWLSISDSETTPTSYDQLNQERVVNPSGDIYVHFAGNFGFEDEVKPRSGELYIAHSDDRGRTKVIIYQEKFDVYLQPIEIQPYTYVGTFHRWNETGERLIRIASKPEFINAGYQWRATVIYGDFIRLSTDRSPDAGVGIHPYGVGDNPNWTTSAQIEASSDKASNNPSNWYTSIAGTAQALEGDNTLATIYFRVSLTGTLPSSQSEPRYGLIALSHKGGTHFIYVRQGEQADYLMRKEDEIGRNPNNSTNPQQPDRPLSVKFSPYNLTDLNRNSDGWFIEGNNPGQAKFGHVTYPSQAGYYFNQSSRGAFAPNTKSENLTINKDATPAEIVASDVCPPGYRRPHDGSTTTLLENPLVSNSEFRQSLWLYPLNGNQDVLAKDVPNARMGYYADGFFDRRPIITPNISEDPAKAKPYRAVVGLCEQADNADLNIAFAGTLYFNPHNHASLFFPQAGMFNNSGRSSIYEYGGIPRGQFGLRGDGGVYLSNTGYTASQGKAESGVYNWTYQFGFVSSDKYVLDAYQHNTNWATSTRCVYEPSVIK